ncbi:MAG: ABC transporter ATP-binding protein [Rickettsiales bacterium]|nr:ABC transporter ATP-binding protein [Rickettsiales bacterium]
MKNNSKIPSKVIPFIWYFVKSCKFKILQVYLISAINDIAYLFGGAYVYKLLSNHANSNTLNFENDLIYAIFFVYTAVNYTFTLFLIKSADTKWRNSVEFNIGMKLFINTIKHEISYFNNNLSGNLAVKISNVVYNVDEIFKKLYYVIFNNLTFFVGLAIFWTISIWLFIFAFVWFISFYVVLIILKKKISQAAEENAKEKSKSTGIINDCFTNISNIKMFANERKEFRTIKKQSLNILRSEAKILFVKNKMSLVLYLFACGFIFGTVAITFIEFKKGLIDLGTIMFVLSYSSFMGWFVMNAIRRLMDIISSCGVINDALKLLTQPIKINDKTKTEKIVVNEGRIIFKNVRFSYAGE